ncbi:hypothetical protein MH117_22025 [Paenibacillus sp. ACRRX]|uniref:hypothetical protein n=1 Tax=Paenibacillus sp. ACRRX TaxID=2918206 RepID=UPI001EF4565F|nr:hypothetical protein [Paenibacillus sp. ACRRX]MCG7410095.1 hypothetical protein [Paenibacillus sp. ACRRX]
MTWLRVVNPRNLMIFLCVTAVVMIGFKGVWITQKIMAFNEAERLYASKDLVAAEDWYQKARGNHSLQYKELELAARLQKLAPITEIKQSLSIIAEEADNAGQARDFAVFMQVYDKLQQIRGPYMAPKSQYASFYRQISGTMQLSERMIAHLQQFKLSFYEQMKENMQQGRFEEETFRTNLLRIPAFIYGSSAKKEQQLSTKFQQYDEAKLASLASAGKFQGMLSEALHLINVYTELNFTSDWVYPKTKKLAATMMEKDVGRDQVSAFIVHAKDYTSFMTSTRKDSDMETYLRNQIRAWMRKAGKLISKGNYQQGIALYKMLGDYQDTKAEIKAAELAWAIAEPVRLLPALSGNQSYAHVISGQHQFGAKTYVIAVDPSNRLTYARWDNDDQIQSWNMVLPEGHASIRRLSLEEHLSTNSQPVLLLESTSETRKAKYTAFFVGVDTQIPLFQFEADGYEAAANGTLLVYSPNVANAEGRTAVYERHGNSYQLASFQSDYTMIAAQNLLNYYNVKVQFTCNIVLIEGGDVYGEMGSSYVKLTGAYPFQTGQITITGSFHEYAELNVNNELHKIPVFQVESVEKVQ